jgi:hypothetical protein
MEETFNRGKKLSSMPVSINESFEPKPIQITAVLFPLDGGTMKEADSSSLITRLATQLFPDSLTNPSRRTCSNPYPLNVINVPPTSDTNNGLADDMVGMLTRQIRGTKFDTSIEFKDTATGTMFL